MDKNNVLDKLCIESTSKKTLLAVLVLLFIAFFFVIYSDTLIHLFSIWRTSEGSHGPLIVAVSIYLIWINRQKIKGLSLQPSIAAGTLLTTFGCFLLFIGKLSSTILIQQVSLVPTLLGIVWLIGGKAYLKVLFLPVGYLIFLTGLIERLLAGVAIQFQLVSAWLSAQLLRFFGQPVVLNGTIVELPHISLEVVKSCSGISHIVSLIALSIPLAVLSHLSLSRKIILVVAAFFIGVFANGLRIALIGIYALFNKGADLHGPKETLYVTFIFFFGMVVLVVLSRFLKKRTAEVPNVKGASNKDSLSDLNHVSGTNNRFLLSWGVAVLLVSLSFLFIHFYKIDSAPLTRSLNDIPRTVNGFISRDIGSFRPSLRPFPADKELIRSYADKSGNRVELYIGYFAQQTRQRKLIDYRRDWMHEDSKIQSIDANGTLISVNHFSLRDSVVATDIYFWYVMDGKIVTNPFTGKLYTALNGLFKRKTNGSIVIVQSIGVPVQKVMPFLQSLVPGIMSVLDK